MSNKPPGTPASAPTTPGEGSNGPSLSTGGTEWAAKWSDGGYCPASPPRNEQFARNHARNFGTRPIWRLVGQWRYADTDQIVDFGGES